MGPPLSSIHNGHLEVVYETGSKMCSDVMSYSPYFHNQPQGSLEGETCSLSVVMQSIIFWSFLHYLF